MSPLGLSLLLPLALLGTNTEDYSEARRTTTESGRPMVVMVGAEWCPACVQMKDTALPKVRERGLLRKVAFAVVDLDREKELGTQLTEGGPIPQLLMYRKTSEGWRLRRLVGGQDVAAIESFIDEGIRLDQATKHEEKKSPGNKDNKETKTAGKSKATASAPPPAPSSKPQRTSSASHTTAAKSR